MRKFSRKFDIDRLEREFGQHAWFRELLSLWTPAGMPAPLEPSDAYAPRMPCLRMAVRDPGLDMYRLGQRIASIKFGTTGGLRSKIHEQYIRDGAEGQAHATVNRDGLHFSDGTHELYREGSSLISWLKRAEDYKRDKEKEKKFVDLICGIKANANIVDLEMGLPALASAVEKRALRMDLVALEQTPTGIWQVVFWEAKLASNPELGKGPDAAKGIFAQVKGYMNWISDGDNRRLVSEAYFETCKILVGLHRLAREICPHIGPLGDGIVAVGAGSKHPEVDPKPRIIIDDRGTKRSTATLERRLDRLRDADIHVQVVSGVSDLALGRAI